MTINHQIEMATPRLFEDFRLAEESGGKIREISVIQSAYDSVICSGFTYVSTPITSGSILYSVMDKVGAKTIEEIQKDKSFFYENVIRPNINAAENTAINMLKFSGAVISPAIFEAKKLNWSQNAYMALWLDVIEKKVTRIAMVDGWEYSNGGAEEYLQSLLMQAGRRDRNNIEIVDANGDILTHSCAVNLLTKAIVDLISRGFTPTTLVRVLWRIQRIHDMVYAELEYGVRTDPSKSRYEIGSSYFKSLALDNISDISTITKELQDIFPKILDEQEIVNDYSLQMYPTFIRTSELSNLSEAGAIAITKEEKT